MRVILFPFISEGSPPKGMDRQDRVWAILSPRNVCYQWVGLFWNEWFVTSMLSAHFNGH